MQWQQCTVEQLVNQWWGATHLSISSFSFLENSPKMLCRLTCICCTDAEALESRKICKTDAL